MMWQASACHTKQICSELKFKCNNPSLTYPPYMYHCPTENVMYREFNSRLDVNVNAS